MRLRKNFPLLVGAVFVLLSVGCASTSRFSPSISLRDFPEVETETTVEIGSPLVFKARVSEFDGLVLSESVTVRGTGINLGTRFEFEPNEFIAAESDSSRIYYHAIHPERAKYFALGLQSDSVKGNGNQERVQLGRIGISENRKTGEFEVFFLQGKLVSRASFPPGVRLDRKKIAKSDAPGFRQELLYNGKSGETIKVLYREFQNDMARPAFSQELTYDLAESDIIGFQGVRIRVIRATNVAITYSVLKHFPPIQ